MIPITRRTIIAGLALALSAHASRAQMITPDFMKPPFLPPDSTVVTAVRAGWLVDVENGKVLRDQVIVVRGDKIVSVEAAPGHSPRARR